MKIIQHYDIGADRTYALQKNDVTVIALAEGKENAYAEMGAETVTKTISDFFCDNFDRFYNMRFESEMKKVFVDICQSSLKNEADKKGIDDVEELSSTLLVVAAKGNKAIVCHIGDGAICKIMEKSTRTVSAPYKDGSEKKTCFITSPEAEEYLTVQKCKIDNVVAFFMMNDNLAQSVFDKNTLCFKDSARKMSLTATETDGESKLEEMINSSSESGNCSFIAMVFDERVTSHNVGVTERKYEGLYEKSEEDKNSDYLDENFASEKNDDEEYVLSFPVDENRKKYKLTAVLVAIVLAVITVFCIVIAKSASDKKVEKVTTSSGYEESSATESDLTDNSTFDTTEEFSEEVTENFVDTQADNTTTEKASTTENSTVETTTEKEENLTTEEPATEKTTAEKETTTAVTTTEPTTESTTSPVTEPVSETQNSNNGMLEDLFDL